MNVGGINVQNTLQCLITGDISGRPMDFSQLIKSLLGSSQGTSNSSLVSGRFVLNDHSDKDNDLELLQNTLSALVSSTDLKSGSVKYSLEDVKKLEQWLNEFAESTGAKDSDQELGLKLDGNHETESKSGSDVDLNKAAEYVLNSLVSSNELIKGSVNSDRNDSSEIIKGELSEGSKQVIISSIESSKILNRIADVVHESLDKYGLAGKISRNDIINEIKSMEFIISNEQESTGSTDRTVKAINSIINADFDTGIPNIETASVDFDNIGNDNTNFTEDSPNKTIEPNHIQNHISTSLINTNESVPLIIAKDLELNEKTTGNKEKPIEPVTDDNVKDIYEKIETNVVKRDSLKSYDNTFLKIENLGDIAGIDSSVKMINSFEQGIITMASRGDTDEIKSVKLDPSKEFNNSFSGIVKLSVPADGTETNMGELESPDQNIVSVVIKDNTVNGTTTDKHISLKNTQTSIISSVLEGKETPNNDSLPIELDFYNLRESLRNKNIKNPLNSSVKIDTMPDDNGLKVILSGTEENLNNTFSDTKNLSNDRMVQKEPGLKIKGISTNSNQVAAANRENSGASVIGIRSYELNSTNDTLKASGNDTVKIENPIQNQDIPVKEKQDYKIFKESNVNAQNYLNRFTFFGDKSTVQTNSVKSVEGFNTTKGYAKGLPELEAKVNITSSQVKADTKSKMNELSGDFSSVLSKIGDSSNSESFKARTDNIPRTILRHDYLIDAAVKGFKAVRLPDITELKIKLRPEELGDIVVKVSLEKGQVNGNITAEKMEVANLLQNNIENFKQELRNNNINITSVSVNVGGEQGGGSQGQFNENFRGRQQNTYPSLEEEVNEDIQDGFEIIA